MLDFNNNQGLEYKRKVKSIKENFAPQSDASNNNIVGTYYSESTGNDNYGILYNSEDDSKFNDAIENINNSEISELRELKTEYDRSVSDYQVNLRILNNMINNYSTAFNTTYKNKNVKLSDGTVGYITNNGVWKEYSSRTLYDTISKKGYCPTTKINDLTTLNGRIDPSYNIIDINTRNKFIIGTPMTENQSCGISGTNIYVTNTAAPVNTQQYSGCYNMSDSNGLIYQSDMGNNATLNSCRIRAFDTNSEVFAISSSNGLPNNGKCYVGKDLNNVINGGQAIYTRVIWKQTIEPLTNSRSARLNYAGQLEILDSQNNVLWVSNPPQDNCDPNNGGRISVVFSSWGTNCDGRKSNSRQEPWSVDANNLLSYSKSIADGKDIAEFTISKNIILPETNSRIGDPAIGCRKDFFTAYRCGDKQKGSANSLYIEEGKSKGSLITYDCQEKTARCENFKLIVNNDLNVVINDGKTKNNIWQTNTTNIARNAISTTDRNSVSSRYEREYIQPGETLLDGEFIGSPNGNCYLIFVNDVGLELRINLPGCSRASDGNYYGGNLTDDMKGAYFTVYNGYFNDDLSFFNTARVINSGITNDLTSISSATNGRYSSSNTNISIVFTGSLYVKEEQSGDWTFKLSSDDGSYMWIGENATKDTSISNAFISNGNTHPVITKTNTIKLNGGVYYPIKIIYGNKTSVGAFKLLFSGPGVSERSVLNDYIFGYVPNDGLATYSITLSGDNINNLGKVGYVTPDGKLKTVPTRLIKLSNKEYNNNYIEIGNYSNVNNSQYNVGVINSSTVDNCKSECNKKDNCYGFVYKDNKCYLKGSDIYPQSARIYDENARLFKRNIDILTHSSCNKNVVSVDNNRWNYFPLDESGDTINENTECEMTLYLKDQKNKVLESSNKLKDISYRIINRIDKLNNNDRIIINELGITKKNILTTLDDINSNKSKYDSQDNLLINETGMKNSSYDQLLNNNYNYLVWSILAVSIGIGSIYYAKKRFNN